MTTTAYYSNRSATPLPPNFQLGPSRAPLEYYPTPPEATRLLCAYEHFDGSIWEPACGDGWMSRALMDAGHDVVSTDLGTEYPFIKAGHGTGGVDFLDTKLPRAKHIVTNPPYGSGLADAFAKKALDYARLTGGKVALLLNLASLAHPSRTSFFKANPPARIIILDDLVCWPMGKPERATRATTSHRYCWAVFTPAELPSITTLLWGRCASFTAKAPRHQFNLATRKGA